MTAPGSWPPAAVRELESLLMRASRCPMATARRPRSRASPACSSTRLAAPPWSPATRRSAPRCSQPTSTPSRRSALPSMRCSRAPALSIAVIARNAVHARRVHRDLFRGCDAGSAAAGAFDQPGIVVTHCADIQGLEFDAVVIRPVTGLLSRHARGAPYSVRRRHARPRLAVADDDRRGLRSSRSRSSKDLATTPSSDCARADRTGRSLRRARDGYSTTRSCTSRARLRSSDHADVPARLDHDQHLEPALADQATAGVDEPHLPIAGARAPSRVGPAPG